MQFREQLGGGAEQGRVSSQYGGVADVLRDHGFAQTVGATRTRLRASARKSSVSARSMTSRSMCAGRTSRSRPWA